MLSVSDDRSIRLWSVSDETCLHVLYGHTARVWDAQYTDENIVSIGEDAMCVLWNLQGSIVRKYAGHKGVYIITSPKFCMGITPKAATKNVPILCFVCLKHLTFYFLSLDWKLLK